MKKLNLQEAPKTVAFTFGRFNPPTIGHEKLLDKVASMRADEYLIFASHTRNPKKDPLEYSLKIAYMQRSFPKHKRNIIVSKARNIFEILVDLQKMYNPIGNPLKSLIMVVGSDRVKEFEGLINKYNGVKATHGYYNFQNIQVKSAGERDPDAEGVEGMSASKMRVAAADSDFDSFKLGTPLKDTDAKKLYFSVRRAMGIREELDLTNYEVLRDLYLAEQIWNVGELIKVKGNNDFSYPTWEIIRRGTNYVTVIDESYNPRKIWLHDIEIDDVASRLDKSRVYPKIDESWFDDLVSKIKSKTIRKSAYQYAKDLLQSVIDRKKRDKTLKHDKLYYAQRIGDQITGVDYRMLAKMVKEENVKQDQDIKDKEGTQPAKYYAGDMAKSTKDKRATHFKKKKAGPAPGDATATTKPSKHTLKFKQMFDEEKIKGLINKAEKSGISYSILKKVYDRGMAAWKTGHRPGTTPQQWAFARVNSFITKSSGTWGKADADLAKQVRGESIEDKDTIIEASIKTGIPYNIVKKLHYKEELTEKEINIAREEIKEYYLMGTPEYMDYLKKLTPGEENNDWGEIEEDAEYAGRTVKLNNPTKGDTKKFKVYVRNDKGNVVKVEFGDPNMEIKRDDPKRLKAFRARFGCDKDPGPKWKAKYWACKFWEKGKTVTDLMKG